MIFETTETTGPAPSPSDLTAIWGVSLTAIHCAQCGTVHLVPESDVPARCPYCAQGRVDVEPSYLSDERPEMALPYAVSDENLTTILAHWTQRVPFRPADMEAGALARRATRYMIPVWLVDGRVAGAWHADVGFDYQAVSYQDRYIEGSGWRSRQVQESRVRWEPRAGRIDRQYDNLDIPALDGHQRLMSRLGDFDLSPRIDYSVDQVRRSAIRAPSRTPAAAWPEAESAFDRASEADCLQATAGDHIRDFVLDAEYDGLNWTLLLLPAYVTWYREGEQDWPVMINGQNGRVSGIKRASASKATTTSLVLGGIAMLLFVLGGLLALLGVVFPLAGVVGVILLIIGVVVAMGAPAPAIAAWTHNRRGSLEDWP